MYHLSYVHLTFNQVSIKYNSTENPVMRVKIFTYKPHSILGKAIDVVEYLVADFVERLESGTR